MLAVLDKLIKQNSFVLKLRHGVGVGVSHAHTTALVNQDETGQYWLDIKCHDDKCRGHLRKRIPPELVKEWEIEERG